MIVYADTSALVKLFVNEAHSDSVRQWIQAASQLVVSEVTWTEMCAALSLKKRTGQLASAQANRVLATMRQHWARYHKLGTDAALFTEAGELALRLNLRAYDSVQLASAWRAFGATGPALSFCCFDQKLNSAAKSMGLPVLTAG